MPPNDQDVSMIEENLTNTLVEILLRKKLHGSKILSPVVIFLDKEYYY